MNGPWKRGAVLSIRRQGALNRRCLRAAPHPMRKLGPIYNTFLRSSSSIVFSINPSFLLCIAPMRKARKLLARRTTGAGGVSDTSKLMSFRHSVFRKFFFFFAPFHPPRPQTFFGRKWCPLVTNVHPNIVRKMSTASEIRQSTSWKRKKLCSESKTFGKKHLRVELTMKQVVSADFAHTCMRKPMPWDVHATTDVVGAQFQVGILMSSGIFVDFCSKHHT